MSRKASGKMFYTPNNFPILRLLLETFATIKPERNIFKIFLITFHIINKRFMGETGIYPCENIH